MLASIHELNVMYMHIGNHSHIVETVPLSKLVHYCKLPIHCIVETVTDLQEVWKGGCGRCNLVTPPYEFQIYLGVLSSKNYLDILFFLIPFLLLSPHFARKKIIL